MQQAAEKIFENFLFFLYLPLDDIRIRGRIRFALEGSGNVLSFSGRTGVRQNKLFDKLTVKPNQTCWKFVSNRCVSSESAAPSAGYDLPGRAQEKPAGLQRFVFAVSAVTVFQHFRCPAAMPDISVEPFSTISAGASAMVDSTIQIEGFDPGSERTLAAWLRHASRTDH